MSLEKLSLVTDELFSVLEKLGENELHGEELKMRIYEAAQLSGKSEKVIKNTKKELKINNII